MFAVIQENLTGFFVYSQSSFLSKDFIACSVYLRHFKSKCYQSCDLFRPYLFSNMNLFQNVCVTLRVELWASSYSSHEALWFLIPEDHFSSTTCQRVKIKPNQRQISWLQSALFLLVYSGLIHSDKHKKSKISEQEKHAYFL